jgi:hypothetical protein
VISAVRCSGPKSALVQGLQRYLAEFVWEQSSVVGDTRLYPRPACISREIQHKSVSNSDDPKGAAWKVNIFFHFVVARGISPGAMLDSLNHGLG